MVSWIWVSVTPDPTQQHKWSSSHLITCCVTLDKSFFLSESFYTYTEDSCSQCFLRHLAALTSYDLLQRFQNMREAWVLVSLLGQSNSEGFAHGTSPSLGLSEETERSSAPPGQTRTDQAQVAEGNFQTRPESLGQEKQKKAPERLSRTEPLRAFPYVTNGRWCKEKLR